MQVGSCISFTADAEHVKLELRDPDLQAIELVIFGQWRNGGAFADTVAGILEGWSFMRVFEIWPDVEVAPGRKEQGFVRQGGD